MPKGFDKNEIEKIDLVSFSNTTYCDYYEARRILSGFGLGAVRTAHDGHDFLTVFKRTEDDHWYSLYVKSEFRKEENIVGHLDIDEGPFNDIFHQNKNQWVSDDWQIQELVSTTELMRVILKSEGVKPDIKQFYHGSGRQSRYEQDIYRPEFHRLVRRLTRKWDREKKKRDEERKRKESEAAE